MNTNSEIFDPEIIWGCMGNLPHWAYYFLGVDLYINQEQILEAVCDPSIKKVAVLGARGGGKSIAVCCGIVKWCIDNPNFQIGLFGPKEEQATRLLIEIKKMAKDNSQFLFDAINWPESNTTILRFKNGSEIHALSADKDANADGHHFSIVVIDEAHEVDSSVANSTIGPMLGSLPIDKTIKIGIAMYKNHFWESCNNGNYKVIKHDWTQSPIYLRVGESFYYEGKPYSLGKVQTFPLSVKQKLFPNRPDLHTEGEMTELEYQVNYEMTWAEDIHRELSESDRGLLTDSQHGILSQGINEKYFFGLDTASGGIKPGASDRDYTVLSIWRKRADGVMEKVAIYEFRDEDIKQQMNAILAIIHPLKGKFPASFGLVDASGWGIDLVQQFQKLGIPIDGVAFGGTEPITKKNYKNAMFDHFKIELQNLRVKYPSMATIDQSRLFKKAYNEFVSIERHLTGNLNAKISAPNGLHDDHVMADVLCVYGMDFPENFDGYKIKPLVLFSPRGFQGGVASTMSNPQQGNQSFRYL